MCAYRSEISVPRLEAHGKPVDIANAIDFRIDAAVDWDHALRRSVRAEVVMVVADVVEGEGIGLSCGDFERVPQRSRDVIDATLGRPIVNAVLVSEEHRAARIEHRYVLGLREPMVNKEVRFLDNAAAIGAVQAVQQGVVQGSS